MDINSINNGQDKAGRTGRKKSEGADNAGKTEQKKAASQQGLDIDDKITLNAISIKAAQNIRNLILSDHEAATLAMKNIDALKAQKLLS